MGSHRQPPISLGNLRHPFACRLWCVFPVHSRLEVRAASLRGTLHLGKPPEWLREEVAQQGLGDFVEASLGIPWLGLGRWARMRWAMRHGIAPGQPFLVEVDPPEHTSSSTPDGTEWDTRYSGEVLAVMPLPPEEVARRWEVWTAARLEEQRREAHECAIRQARRILTLELANEDVRTLFLRLTPYVAWRQGSWEWPKGRRIHLCSLHGGVELLQAESDVGDVDAVLAQLERLAAAKLPHLPPGLITRLPRGNLKLEGKGFVHDNW